MLLSHCIPTSCVNNSILSAVFIAVNVLSSPYLAGIVFAFSFFLSHSCSVLVLYVIRKLGVCTFCPPQCFKWVYLLLSSGDPKVEWSGVMGWKWEFWRPPQISVNEKKKKKERKKSIKIYTCATLFTPKVTLVLFPPQIWPFITMNADLLSSPTLLMPLCLPLSPGMSPSDQRLPKTAHLYENSRRDGAEQPRTPLLLLD